MTEENDVKEIVGKEGQYSHLVVVDLHSVNPSQCHLENKNLLDIPKLHALLKHFVNMEVIQWVPFWDIYQIEFGQERTMPSVFLGDKIVEDLRQRIF
jgi:hypothetical protein